MKQWILNCIFYLLSTFSGELFLPEQWFCSTGMNTKIIWGSKESISWDNFSVV